MTKLKTELESRNKRAPNQVLNTDYYERREVQKYQSVYPLSALRKVLMVKQKKGIEDGKAEKDVEVEDGNAEVEDGKVGVEDGKVETEDVKAEKKIWMVQQKKTKVGDIKAEVEDGKAEQIEIEYDKAEAEDGKAEKNSQKEVRV